MSEPTSWTVIARVVKPQGRHGEVLAEILTDFPERYTQSSPTFLRRSEAQPLLPVKIENAWPHKDRIVLKLAGVDSITDAESLREAEVVIPADARVALGPGEFYIEDLCGCALVDLTPEEASAVGTIRDVLRQPVTADLLVVTAPDGSEHWIPFAAAYRPQVDLAVRRVSLYLPPGILTMNQAPDHTDNDLSGAGALESGSKAPAVS